MLLPSDLHDLRAYVAQLAQRAIDRDDSGSASIRVEVCTAMAVAVHDVLSAVKTGHNDTVGINRLPAEVLGAIFFQLTVYNRPVRNICLASAVCRRWRDVALSTPQLWTRIDDSGECLPVDLFALWLERSGALPVSVVCAGGTDCLVLKDHMCRIRRLVLTKWWTGWAHYLMSLIDLPAPALETLWLPEWITLPANIFSSCAPKLRTLAVQLSVFEETNSYPALRGVTCLHLLSHPDEDEDSPWFERDIILHILSELPNLATLVGVTPLNLSSAPMSPQEQMDLRDHGLRVVQATDHPLSGARMMDSLHILRYDRIRDVSISRPSSFTLESLFSAVLPDRPYTHVTLDRIRGQVALRTQDGFTRALTECKAHRSTSTLHHVATSLTSLTVAGRLYQDAIFLPAFPVLRTLTIAVHSSDFPPSAMRLKWSCSCLKTLCLTSIRDRESISSGAVETFISTSLEFADDRLAELRLDSVEVAPSASDSRAGTADHSTALLLLVEKITSTSAILEPLKVEKYWT